MKNKHILFTGGGSAGHVTPNIALIKKLQAQGWQVSYVGSYQGIERSLIEPLAIPYFGVNTGKLNRDFSWQIFLTPFKVLQGIAQSYNICRKLKPSVVFSKGGFVALPVVIGAWLNGIPVVAHESDLTPGLANRLSYPFVKKVAVSFEQSKNYFSNQQKVVYTGTPIREEMIQGDADKGKAFLNFEQTKPILLIYGGGLGSVAINQAIRNILPQLTQQFNIVHCCGKGKTDPAFDHVPAYKQFDYLNEELPDVMAAATLVVSRAGANSIYELLKLCKPSLLIPLSKKASRGDQIDNAKFFAKLGLCLMLEEENLNDETLMNEIEQLWQQHSEFEARLKAYPAPDATSALIALIDQIK